MHNHDGHQDHDHALIPEETGESILLERAVRELLLEKGVIDADSLRRRIDQIDSANAMLGARLVARAWIDSSFCELLVANPKAAAQACLGITLPDSPEIAVVANEEKVHHVIVCTLCSCYPKALLGLPPDWYKSFSYRSRMVVQPRAVLEKFGTIIPPEIEIRVVDSTADMRYLVLPLRPHNTDGWSEDELLSLITRDSMIGVTLPTATAQ
jgi:nitrile hydratase